jgi:hypothetical protein
VKSAAASRFNSKPCIKEWKMRVLTLFIGSRMFLYLGTALIALAVLAFPIRMSIEAQPMTFEYFSIGWLFAPILGVWGLASTVLGLVQSSQSKRKIESYLLLILAVATVSLAYAAYLVIVFGSGIVSSFGRGEPFFWVYFSLVLAPSLLIYASSIMFMGSKNRLAFLANRRVRITTFVALAAVPLLYTVIFLLLIYLL